MSASGDTPPGGLIPALIASLILRRHAAPPPPARPAPHWPEAPREGVGHETEDVDIRRTGLVMAGLMLSAALAVGVMLWLMHLYAGSQRRALPDLTAQQTARLIPPAPNLQADPYADLARARAAERAQLDGYARLDAARGRIPIDRAMSLTVGRSLDPVNR